MAKQVTGRQRVMNTEPVSQSQKEQRLDEWRTPVLTAVPLPGEVVQVHKLRPDGSERLSWEGVVLRADESGMVLRAQFSLAGIDLGCTTFVRGDVFVEYYFWDRCYTVSQVWDANGKLKGWYCDVCMPAHWKPPSDLSYTDLALDLWQGADGGIVLLDEQEFALCLAAGVFTQSQIESAERGWVELRALAESGELPEWSSG